MILLFDKMEGGSELLGSVSEFNEFEPRIKFAKNRFQSSAGLNLNTLNTTLSGTNHALSRVSNLNRDLDFLIRLLRVL